MKVKIITVIGTRADALKLVPVIQELKKDDLFDSYVCSTDQHDEMLQQVLDIFDIKIDFRLNVMKESQSLEYLTSNIMLKFSKILEDLNPERIIVQGDTSTTFIGALGAFYKKIPVAHVEAGLRTNDIYSPYPEELNRRLTSQIADLHFAPTLLAFDNLKKELIDQNKIFVTGNTIIDALFCAKKILSENDELKQNLNKKFSFLDKSKKLVLITCHRRENFGLNFKDICKGLSDISNKNNIQIVFPVHLNPNVKKAAHELLGENKNIHLIEPQSYFPFVYLMQKSSVILTDSGGIQEEAPYLKKQVLVLREKTERPEALETGLVKIIGTKAKSIVDNVELALLQEEYCNSVSIEKFPFGNGRASKTIVEHLNAFYQNQKRNEVINSKSKQVVDEVFV